MQERLSYTDFQDEFLLAVAVFSRADTGKHIDPAEALKHVDGRYQKSWILAATKQLSDHGYINGRTFISGSGMYALTGDGLQRAEEIASSKGADLYELIDEAHPVLLTDEDGNVLTDDESNPLTVPPEDVDYATYDIVTRDPLSEAFKELDEQMALTIRELRANNHLMESEGPAADQRLAELEAGKILMKAEQSDASLVRRVVLPALQWLSKKVADEVAKQGIQKLIAMVIILFGSNS